ncbi:ecdysone-induced protein 78C [Caerostris darwini]|uniref:Ecdysone-induced protein 78C n=1 Tax=Caerostris darwini TaxID=1538125 RepID=A0AAV4T103_9ARAC|nr:ecdysone-induced protein 78C [Caerostris darwini]
MSRDSVRYGRVPKRTRERMEENRVAAQVENEQSMPEVETKEVAIYDIREMENKELAIYDLTLTISQAHYTTCDYLEARSRNLEKKPAIFNLNLSDFNPNERGNADSMEMHRITTWQYLATYLTPCIQRLVEFAKRIPGFLKLSQDDQLRLIKTGFFEVWVMHVAKFSGPSENFITFFDGSYITRQQIEVMFDYEFVVALFNFITSINSLELNDIEIGLSSAVILLTSQRKEIGDPMAIEYIQDRLVEALKVTISKHHTNDPNCFAILMMKLADLRALGDKHAEHLTWFQTRACKLNVPPLFAEIFDIPLANRLPPQQQTTVVEKQSEQ